MRLYSHPASDASRKVLLTAVCLGIELDVQIVDVSALAHQAPDYLRLNPNGLFPVLIDGDFVLWESTAITQYLAAVTQDETLWPNDVRMRADITRWQCWDIAHWSPALRPYIWERVGKRLKSLGEPDEEALNGAAAGLRRFAGILDLHLENRHWLAGAGLTLADLCVASHLMYRTLAQLPLAGYANITRWSKEVEALPCWRMNRPSIEGVL